METKSVLLALLLAVSLNGCASYKDYSNTYQAVGVANASALSEKYKAMQAIGVSGSEAAKVAAVMSMMMDKGDSGMSPLKAPESVVDTSLRLLSIIVPAAVQGYGIRATALTSMRQSDNAAATAISTNNTFVGIAGKIQSAPSNSNVSNYSATSSNSNYSATDSHAVTGSHNPNTSSTTSSDTQNNSVNGSFNIPAPIPK